MLTSLIVLLMVAAAPSRGRFVLQPGAFLKLPGATDNYALNTATKAAYDPQEHFLYVVGYQADVLHVVDMTDPSSPQLLETKLFDQINQGLPDAIHVCRGGLNRNYLAVTFESRNLAIKGRVLFFDLLDTNTVSGPLTMITDVVTSILESRKTMELRSRRPFLYTVGCGWPVRCGNDSPCGRGHRRSLTLACLHGLQPFINEWREMV